LALAQSVEKSTRCCAIECLPVHESYSNVICVLACRKQGAKPGVDRAVDEKIDISPEIHHFDDPCALKSYLIMVKTYKWNGTDILFQPSITDAQPLCTCDARFKLSSQIFSGRNKVIHNKLAVIL
jgi:hypothetical protein